MFVYTTLIFKHIEDLFVNDKSSGYVFKIFMTFILVTAALGPALFADTILTIASVIFRNRK
jgi:hypothetical protein